MRFRKLRIAWSAGWGVAAVVLVVFWVRSYWWLDNIQTLLTPTRTLQCTSQEGVLYIASDGDTSKWLSTTMHTPRSDPDFAAWRLPAAPFHFELYDRNSSKGVRFRFPCWLPVLLSVALAAASWIRRFSLRTLLIATTLFAVVLGLVMYVTRQ